MMEYRKGKRLVQYVPDYIVFDLETTGISVLKDEIVEVSALKVKEHQIVDRFSTLVNPGRPIPYRATAVHGISDEMVATAPPLGAVMEEFLEFAGSQILVGHNIHTFDLKFIGNAAGEILNRTIDNDYIDTLYMSRQCLPQLKTHKLVDLAAYFQINAAGAHRALNDCIMNQQCFEELGKIQQGIALELCPKCGGEMKKRSGKFGEFMGCGNFPNCRYTKKVSV